MVISHRYVNVYQRVPPKWHLHGEIMMLYWCLGDCGVSRYHLQIRPKMLVGSWDITNNIYIYTNSTGDNLEQYIYTNSTGDNL